MIDERYLVGVSLSKPFSWIEQKPAAPSRDSKSQLQQYFINYADGAYTLSFMRPIYSSDPHDISLNQDVYFFFPVGGGTYSPSNGNIRMHSRTPIISPQRYNLANCDSAGKLLIKYLHPPSPSPRTSSHFNSCASGPFILTISSPFFLFFYPFNHPCL